MNPYFFTLSFLLIMSLLTASEVTRFVGSALDRSCYFQACEQMAMAEEIREQTHFVELKKLVNPQQKQDKIVQEKTKPPQLSKVAHAKALGVNAARPPNNSRLNLYLLLHGIPHAKLPTGYSLYESVAQLIRLLYGEEPFFKEIPQLEQQILDLWIQNKEATLEFTSPEELAQISLESLPLQTALYYMFTGTAHAPSLLNYLTFDKVETSATHTQSRKLNLFFADPFIVKALFPEAETAEQLLAFREELWQLIEYQEEHRREISPGEALGRRALSKRFKAGVQEILTHQGLEADAYTRYVFDLTLGKPGTLLFFSDPLSGRLLREKYTPPAFLRKPRLPTTSDEVTATDQRDGIAQEE